MSSEVSSDIAAFDVQSEPFLGQWNRLVSTTNWQKGRIVHDWREALIASDAQVQQYSDEAWSQLVGNVTSQHVGRLRRVYERFHASYEQYQGLYWSHFQAAVEWDDAEMWLEGAVQNQWSVAAMRKERGETLGQVAADNEPAASEWGELEGEHAGEELQSSLHEITGDASSATSMAPRSTSDTAGESEAPFGDDAEHAESSLAEQMADPEPIEPVRPFENLADLPPDLADAFESFKLAILHHKLDGWREIGCADVLATLESLKQLAIAQ